MQTQSPEPVSTLLYRLDAMEKEIAQIKTQLQINQSIAQSVVTMERDIVQLKSQLGLYEQTAYNDLKLRGINDSVGRIETELSKVRDKLEVMSMHMTSQEIEAKERDARTKDGLSKLQIRALWFVVSTIVLVVVGVLVSVGSHLFTH